MTTPRKKQFDHSIFRLVIRNIEGYGTFPLPALGTHRVPNFCPQLDLLKQRVLQCLIQKQSCRKARLSQWSVAWQTHAATGLPHLDILLVYEKNFTSVFTAFDYLIKKLGIRQRDVGDGVGVGHVWVTPYSTKKLSKAILEYSQKEDPSVLTNMTHQSKEDIIRINRLKADPYRYLELQMFKDPLGFNLQRHVLIHDLAHHIKGWASIKTKLKDMQVASANLELRKKPGFRYIDRSFIEERLSSDELKTFDSWVGYQTIIDKLNQIHLCGCHRPFKTLQLLLVGRPNTGKTSLVKALQAYYAVYHQDVAKWWPHYSDGVYPLISWDQFRLTGGMSHTSLLKFLQGSPVDLEYKGGSSLRRDNQLVIMTSNMTLAQHIDMKFMDQIQRTHARANLRARIAQVIVPEGLDLFLLQKLLV